MSVPCPCHLHIRTPGGNSARGYDCSRCQRCIGEAEIKQALEASTLLGQVRRKHGPLCYAEPFDGGTRWEVYQLRPHEDVLLGSGPTEAEALVAALKASPP